MFFTQEDPNAKIKGSRDPLGAQPIWTAFGRHVVTNLTTQTNSGRGFTILLLGRHLAEQAIEGGKIGRELALDAFLRFEQIGAYVRHVAHDVAGDIGALRGSDSGCLSTAEWCRFRRTHAVSSSATRESMAFGVCSPFRLGCPASFRTVQWG